MPGLVIYAAVDGSFAVWDPARNYWREPKGSKDGDEWPRAFLFPPASASESDEASKKPIRRDVANGLEEGGRVLCNGLIADWGVWYYQRSSQAKINPFKYLEDAISVLSHPLEPLTCGEPRKVFLDDTRSFPTLQMPYGVVPYPQWSAGVRRVVSFAYLIVWAWVEHLQAATLRKEPPTDQIILVVDEIEAHLHPKWQRTILPAILRVVEKLQQSIGVQVFAATHSPLVLASIEPHFDEEKDQLFCFNLHTEKPSGKMVSFDTLPWAVHGDVVGWLTSDIFGLEQARSREAENAIEAAEAFLRGEKAKRPDGLNSKSAITAELRNVLSGIDPFWPRWIVEAKG
jgi:AAA domain, putative AbiEii toxin, Type IV TA system